jgi:ATP-dependent DNA ligase
MKPMLAKNFRDHKSRFQYPCFVQPKLNGIRALHHQQSFQSRDQHFWNPEVLSHLLHGRSFPLDVVFDGELYVHGWSLQQINSAIAVNRIAPIERSPQVEYHIFDCILLNDRSAPFSERSRYLSWWYGDCVNDKLKLVDTHWVGNEQEANALYSHFKHAEYEGMMYRKDEPYGLESLCGNKENRWDVLLKRKEFIDWEGEVVEIEESPVNPGTVGSLVFHFDNGNEFKAGSGLKHEQKLRFFSDPPIGKRVRLQYLMLSDNGTPLNPYIECVYE